MLNLRESILADIHDKKIHPRPRWQYILLHTSLGTIGVITIILGSFAFAALLLEISLPERVYFHWMEMQDDSGWISALPYLWGAGIVIAVTIGYFIFSKTGRGYRLQASMIAGILIVGSIAGGELLYVTHTIHWGDQEMQHFAPGYGNFRQRFAHMMPRPEEGFLPLRISLIQEKNIHGSAPDGQEWVVVISCQDDECEENEAKISLDKPAIFEGSVTDTDVFTANEVHFPGPNLHLQRHERGRAQPTITSEVSTPVRSGQ